MQTVLQTLIDIVDRDSASKYALLLMWASLANAIPVCSSMEVYNQQWSCAFSFRHVSL